MAVSPKNVIYSAAAVATATNEIGFYESERNCQLVFFLCTVVNLSLIEFDISGCKMLLRVRLLRLVSVLHGSKRRIYTCIFKIFCPLCTFFSLFTREYIFCVEIVSFISLPMKRKTEKFAQSSKQMQIVTREHGWRWWRPKWWTNEGKPNASDG